ncbi:hypothetical protein IPF37_02755 [bacterium]|nr:MAG: hypothetical protein IPF37_02755 [bacterium]
MKHLVNAFFFVLIGSFQAIHPAASSSSFSSSSSIESDLCRKIIGLFHDFGEKTFIASDSPTVATFFKRFEKVKHFMTDNNAKFDWCRRFNIPMTVRILSEHAHTSRIDRIVKIDHKSFVTLSLGGEVKVWAGDARVNDWHWVADLADRAYICTVAALNSQTIVTGCHGGYLVLWEQDVASGVWKKVSQLEGHTHAILGIAVIDKDTIVTAGSEDTIKIWQRVLGSQVWQPVDIFSTTNRLASIAALDKNTFVTGHKDNGLIRMWSRKNPQSSWRNSGLMYCGSDCSIERLEKLDDKNFIAESYKARFFWTKKSNEREWHLSKMSTKRDTIISYGGFRNDICSWIPFDQDTLIVGYSSGIPRVWKFPSVQEITLRIVLRDLSEAVMQKIYDELVDLT